MMKWWWWIRDVVDDDESEMLLMMMMNQRCCWRWWIKETERILMLWDWVWVISFVCFVYCWSRRFAVWNLVLETLSLWDLVWAILYLCVFRCVLCIVGAKVAGWFSRVIVDAGVWRSWLSPSTFSSPPNSWILLMVCPASQSHNLISVHLICCTVETLGCSRLLQFCFYLGHALACLLLDLASSSPPVPSVWWIVRKYIFYQGNKTVLLLDADKVDKFKQCYEGQANLNTIAVLTKGGSVFEKRKKDCQGDRKEIEVQIIILFNYCIAEAGTLLCLDACCGVEGSMMAPTQHTISRCLQEAYETSLT